MQRGLLHLKWKKRSNKDAARESKTNDKNAAKFIDDALCVTCFDLQEVLATPKSYESAMYYKRKLNTFDLTVYVLGSAKGFHYVWNETIAKRGLQINISTCIFGNLDSDEHKYLEKDHTQNEGDSIHATIEHASRNISIYTTGQWAAVIRTARPGRRPYIVKELSQSNFFDFC